jgi:cell division protease FtsH
MPDLLRKYRKQWKYAFVAVLTCLSLVLVWFTIDAPKPDRSPLALQMEKNSAFYFTTERDIATLMRDARNGAATSIGLSADYALVNRNDDTRYYVRIEGQRTLAAEILKEQLPSAATAVFALGDVQPPSSAVATFARKFNPAYLSLLGPLLILYLILMMNPARGSGGMFKSADRPATRFKDVIGVEEAKDALQDIVAYLKNPRRFTQLGAQPPKGVVLEGHFGCGKTLLARAVAGEAGVPFIALSGSDFSDMFMGVGVRRVKKLFALARKQAPCVLFIDEIDGLGKRGGGNSAGETENNRIINALLVELDGFKASSGIVVLGATNNVQNIDAALVRPGRFDRTCHLGLPSVDERHSLFELYARKLLREGEIDYRQLARLSSGLTPAGIANAVNSAALLAAKEGAQGVEQAHFQRALEQQLMGGPTAAGQAALDSAERERIAVHEAGHAIVAKVLEVGVVEKVSILKRGFALGATLVTNDQDLTLQSEQQLRARMTMLLGGRTAESLVLGSLSTGAANDLEHVSRMAYRMVTEFGFSSEIGPFSYAGLPEERRPGTNAEAIAEARAVTKEIEIECRALLHANRDALEQLTAMLLEHETVSGAAVEQCLAAAAQPKALAA